MLPFLFILSIKILDISILPHLSFEHLKGKISYNIAFCGEKIKILNHVLGMKSFLFHLPIHKIQDILLRQNVIL
jgi:hypothetical protein